MVPWSPGFGSELMGLRPRVVGRGVGAGTCFPVGELVGKGCDSTMGKHSNNNEFHTLPVYEIYDF